MKTKTNIKSGSGVIVEGPRSNHNQTVVRALKVKTSVKAGSGVITNSSVGR